MILEFKDTAPFTFAANLDETTDALRLHFMNGISIRTESKHRVCCALFGLVNTGSGNGFVPCSYGRGRGGEERMRQAQASHGRVD